MSLHNYLDSLHQGIQKLVDYGYTESVEFKEEIRAIKHAVVTAKIVLLNGSELHIKEYIDARYKVERITYAYHYQDVSGDCIFRYDNAVHKPVLDFREHKHMGDGSILAAGLPGITELLDEIIDYL